MVGKIRLALTPPINHTWNVTLYPTIRGVTTMPMPYGALTLQIDFDFVDHALVIETSDGDRKTIPLEPMTVAEFYRRFMAALHDVSCAVSIWPNPVEIADPNPVRARHTAPQLRSRIRRPFLASAAANHACVHYLSLKISRQGQSHSPVLGSARSCMHALLRPHSSGASKHAGVA